MERRGVVIIMASAVICALLISVIATAALARPALTALCPLKGKIFTIDNKTTLYSCNASDIQLRQDGRETVTFTINHWKNLMKKKETIYQKMGMFDFDGLLINVGKLKKVYISEKGSRGVALNVHQFKKLLEWSPY